MQLITTLLPKDMATLSRQNCRVPSSVHKLHFRSYPTLQVYCQQIYTHILVNVEPLILIFHKTVTALKIFWMKKIK